MAHVFTREHVNVRQAMDIVEWQLGTHKVRLYYQTTIELLHGMRVAAKAAMRHEGNAVALWRDHAKIDQSPSIVPLHHEYRRSGHTSNVKTWRVDVEGSLVAVYLNELEARFHWTDALYFQAWLRTAARQAKNWAGDSSRQLRSTALLTDAEDSYKRGLAN